MDVDKFFEHLLNPATIAALGALYLGWRNGKKIDAGVVKVDQNTALTEKAGQKADEAVVVAKQAVVASTKSVEAVKDQIVEVLNNGVGDRIAEKVSDNIANHTTFEKIVGQVCINSKIIETNSKRIDELYSRDTTPFLANLVTQQAEQNERISKHSRETNAKFQELTRLILELKNERVR